MFRFSRRMAGLKPAHAILLGAMLNPPLPGAAATPDLSICDVWKPACHYTVSSREATYDINRVVIHKTEGATASGAASWFANCSSGGSAHYTFDKSNGQCYQSVREKDIAWHAGYGSTNNCSIGIEHSGWVSSNDTSTACYNDSAYETKSCVTYYGVPANRSYIIGHSQVPGCGTPGGGGKSCHTDPGPYWNWTYYMSQVTNGGGTAPGGNRKGIERTPNGQGYWIVAADGGVFSFGNAGFYGSIPGLRISVSNIVGMAARPQGDGYWLVGSDGGVFCFGAAGFYGSMGGQPLAQPIVAMECTAEGTGYWLVGKDGGIFSFGNAPYRGSCPGSNIRVTNIAGMERGPNNSYWLMGSDGGVFSFGAPFHGSMGGQGYTDFIDMAARSDGAGYWMMRNNGNIYTFGSCQYKGGRNEAGAYISMTPGPSTYGGYWLMKKDGAVYSFGDASYHGGANY